MDINEADFCSANMWLPFCVWLSFALDGENMRYDLQLYFGVIISKFIIVWFSSVSFLKLKHFSFLHKGYYCYFTELIVAHIAEVVTKQHAQLPLLYRKHIFSFNTESSCLISQHSQIFLLPVCSLIWRHKFLSQKAATQSSFVLIFLHFKGETLFHIEASLFISRLFWDDAAHLLKFLLFRV